MLGTKSGSQSGLSGNFPSSDKQPYLEVTAHLNIINVHRGSVHVYLLLFPTVINGPGQPSATSRNEPG